LPALLLLCGSGKANGQPCEWNNFLHIGEETTYDIYFKWGFLMPKAGLARFSVQNARYNDSDAREYKMLFNTTGMFDRIFKMRDTITTYFSPNNHLLFSDKRTDEGGYYLIDKLTFAPVGNKVAIRTERYGRSGLRFDTTLVADGCIFDMMAVTMYLRGIDWENLRINDELPFRVVVGRDIINVRFRYTGQEIVAPDSHIKYRTHHFYIDVYDPAFTQNKAAAEVWVGDDENHVAIRVRAKLKIGSAEVYLANASQLEHPFSCRILSH
jgi:hypothetical protein